MQNKLEQTATAMKFHGRTADYILMSTRQIRK